MNNVKIHVFFDKKEVEGFVAVIDFKQFKSIVELLEYVNKTNKSEFTFKFSNSINLNDISDFMLCVDTHMNEMDMKND